MYNEVIFNQAGWLQAGAWFLKIVLVRTSVCVCCVCMGACVCVIVLHDRSNCNVYVLLEMLLNKTINRVICMSWIVTYIRVMDLAN